MNDFISVISFPGLGIDEFSVNRVAFRLGGLTVTWYGMIICLGIILAFSYFSYRAGKAGINFDSILDFALFTVPLAILGARLYYVIFNPKNFKSFYDIIAIWEGGLAIYGAIIVGAIVVFCVSKYKKLSFLSIAFLYESLWNFLGFALINIFYKKKKWNGEIMLWYFTWYGLGRAIIETLRTDSLYIGNTGIRVSSLLGAVCFAVFAPIIIIARIRYKKLAKEGKISAMLPADIFVLLGIKAPAVNVSENENCFETEETELSEQMQDSESLLKAAHTDLFAEQETETEEDNIQEKTTLNIIKNEDITEEDITEKGQ